MAKDLKLNALSAILRLHSLNTLKGLYQRLNNEQPGETLSHTELVRKLSNETTFEALIDEWPNKLYAHNTTIRIYQLLDSDGQPFGGSKDLIKRHLGARAWNQLTGSGMAPDEVPAEGQLIHVGEINQRLYMLFILPGRAKEVLDGLTLRFIPQTAFLLAVLDSDTGVLQVRGQEPRQFAPVKITKYITSAGADRPIISSRKIRDLDVANQLKLALNGRLHRGRFTHETEEIADITMASQRNVELSRTRKYRDLVTEGYDLNSIGIDFQYNRKEYTLWVGLTTGTYWFRSGDITEDVLLHVQRRILSL